MKTLQLFLALTFSVALIFTSCKKDDLIPDDVELNEVILEENEKLETAFDALNASSINTFLTGIIKDELGNPLSAVEVFYGSTKVITDNKGRFTFGEIGMMDKFNLIKASKVGYFEGFKTFTPTKDAFNTITLQLLSKGSVKTVNAATGGFVTIADRVTLTFEANDLVKRNGELYTGNVNVYGRYLDPNAGNFAPTIIGTLAGLNNDGVIDALVSYGMLTVELEDDNGNKIEIASNKTVGISMPSNGSSNATIPLWHFNETYGLWIEAGEATKVGDNYIAEVNHFSSWNLDINEIGYDADVTIKDQNNNPLANQDITVLSESDNALAQVYTDNNGQFTLLRAPQSLKFKLNLPCGENSVSNIIDISSGTVTVALNTNIGSARSYTLNGNVFDCDENENTFTYNQKYFTLGNSDIYFGGITDNAGNYSLTTVLCDINSNTPHNLSATVSVNNNTIKDTTLTITFTGNSQTANIDYCGTEEQQIDDSFIIPFVDANLVQGIRDAINKPTGAITYGDVKYLDSLRIVSSNISNLSGIEYLTNLTELYLSNNQIIDLDPLNNLSNLNVLSLSSNQIIDLSPLYSLNNLTELYLSSNQIIDISPLYSLNNLSRLSLTGNQISNVSPLNNLSNLTELKLTGNQISNISSLNGLSNLTTLNLSLNQISDINPLNSLINLTTLNINYNQIIDVSPLNSLTNLTVLYLRYNDIIDISLNSLSNLNTLDLSANQIHDVSPLNNLSNLNFLDLGINPISDVSPLNSLTNLINLYLNNILISDVSPLCELGSSYIGSIFLHSNSSLTENDISALRTCLPNAIIYFY